MKNLVNLVYQVFQQPKCENQVYQVFWGKNLVNLVYPILQIPKRENQELVRVIEVCYSEESVGVWKGCVELWVRGMYSGVAGTW